MIRALVLLGLLGAGCAHRKVVEIRVVDTPCLETPPPLESPEVAIERPGPGSACPQGYRCLPNPDADLLGAYILAWRDWGGAAWLKCGPAPEPES